MKAELRKLIPVAAIIFSAIFAFADEQSQGSEAPEQMELPGNGERPPEPPEGMGENEQGQPGQQQGEFNGNGERPPEPPEGMGSGEGESGHSNRQRRGRRPPRRRGNGNGDNGNSDGFGNGERPPEPPGGFGGEHSGTNGNSRSGMRRGRGRGPSGMRGGRGGPGGNGGPGGHGRQGGSRNSRGHGGGMRGDDPSNASMYSGVETVSGKTASLGKVSLDSKETKNTAPLYVKDAGKATVTGGTLASSVSGANAVLVIGKGSEADVSDVTITTTENSSRGLYAFQGGVIRAKNVRISTQGAHCAAMATDRGEGTVTVDGGVLNTAGDGSPCIYSTGDLRAANVTGRATGSEAMVIEGRNSIQLDNAKLQGDRKCGAMLYQSFSGDAREGVAKLTMKNSELSASTGPMFFVTNTRAEIDLENSTLKSASGSPLLSATAGRWGRSGSNGGKVTLRSSNQELSGDIVADSISDVTLEFNSGTSFKARSTLTARRAA